VYLAEFGVTTNRDGSISLDETTFNVQFDAKPDNFSAIMQSRVTTDTNLVKGAVTGSLYEPGTYAFDIASDGSATLDGTAMTQAVNRYSIVTGDAAGLTLDVTGGGLDTNVYIGTSLLDSLRSFSQNIVKTGSDLNTKITRYNSDLLKYSDQLTSLDESVAAARARYVAKFSAMEKVSASMKKTGESLTNMMEAWKATMKNS
jgi:flagellar hook-associated protein 2